METQRTEKKKKMGILLLSQGLRALLDCVCMCVCVHMDSGAHVCSHAYAQVCAFTEIENLTSLSSATIQLSLFVRALLLLWISLNRLV